MAKEAAWPVARPPWACWTTTSVQGHARYESRRERVGPNCGVFEIEPSAMARIVWQWSKQHSESHWFCGKRARYDTTGNLP